MKNYTFLKCTSGWKPDNQFRLMDNFLTFWWIFGFPDNSLTFGWGLVYYFCPWKLNLIDRWGIKAGQRFLKALFEIHFDDVTNMTHNLLSQNFELWIENLQVARFGSPDHTIGWDFGQKLNSSICPNFCI